MTDTPTIDAQHPWPWLDPFTERSSELFGGRDEEVQGLLRSVLATPACVLFGKSGLGKTSLLLAGLFPLLPAHLLIPVPLRRIEHREGAPALPAQLLRALTDTATRATLGWTIARVEDPDSDDVAGLWECLHERGQQLVDREGRRWTPLFVLDQFEEMFTLQLDEGRRQQAFQELGDLIENRVPPAVALRLDAHEDLIDRVDFDSQPYRFLIALREDFLPELESWADLIPRLGPNRYRLLPMSPAQAADSVRKTGGPLVDADSTDRIVQFLARHPATAGAGRDARRIEPALLSLVCASLNEDRLVQDPPGSRLDVSDLESRGARILDRFYDGAFAGLPDAQRTAAAQFVEANLITPSGARRPYPLTAVDTALTPSLRHLVDRRLMRIEPTDQGGLVELVHDRLAAVALQRAQARQRRADEAERLRQAKEAAEMEVFKQKARMAEIAQESARAEQERAQAAVRASRRARRLAGAVAFAAVLALAFAGVAWVQSQDASDARGRAEAETARAVAATARAEAERQRAEDELREAEAATANARQALDTATKALAAAEEARTAARAVAGAGNTPGGKPMQLVIDAGKSYDIAAKEVKQLQDCPAGRRIYPQIGNGTDPAVVDGVAPALRAAGFIVPRVEVVEPAKMPGRTVVRYFRSSEEDGARAAVSALQGAGMRDVTTQFVRGFESSTSVRPCHYELWVAMASAKD